MDYGVPLPTASRRTAAALQSWISAEKESGEQKIHFVPQGVAKLYHKFEYRLDQKKLELLKGWSGARLELSVYTPFEAKGGSYESVGSIGRLILSRKETFLFNLPILDEQHMTCPGLGVAADRKELEEQGDYIDWNRFSTRDLADILRESGIACEDSLYAEKFSLIRDNLTYRAFETGWTFENSSDVGMLIGLSNGAQLLLLCMDSEVGLNLWIYVPEERSVESWFAEEAIRQHWGLYPDVHEFLGGERLCMEI